MSRITDDLLSYVKLNFNGTYVVVYIYIHKWCLVRTFSENKL